MFAKLRGRLGVALLGAAIAVLLNSTLIACGTMSSTGAATGASAGATTGASANPVVWVVVADSTPGGNLAVLADCGEGNHAISGGGHSNTGLSLLESLPAIDDKGTPAPDGTQNPRYWLIAFPAGAAAGAHAEAYAVCMAN
jgi:hypothetical protein